MTTSARAAVGSAVFLVVALPRVSSLQHGGWGETLLVLAALVLLPLLMDLAVDGADDRATVRLMHLARRLQLGAAVGLAFAYVLAPGIYAGLAAAPWAAVLVLLAAVGIRRLSQRRNDPLTLRCRDVGLIYAAVGAAWLMGDRLGLRPLTFEREIVLLTAVHFHYAGLVLPVLTHCALRELAPSRSGRVVAAGIIGGVPAVAVGITATQLRLDPWIESAATMLMATSGFAVPVSWAAGFAGALALRRTGALDAGGTLARRRHVARRALRPAVLFSSAALARYPVDARAAWLAQRPRFCPRRHAGLGARRRQKIVSLHHLSGKYR